MESETAYSLLNVPRTASSEEILLAYRKQSLKFHPQRFDSSDSFIQVHFKKLAEAYETLIDPQKRLEYDRQLILNKLKGSRSRRDTLNPPVTYYPPPNRPGSCAPTIETSKFIQYSKPNMVALTRASTSATSFRSAQPTARSDRHLPRPDSTQAYQNLNLNAGLDRQPVSHRTRPRTDSFSSTSIRPTSTLTSALYNMAPDPRRLNLSSSVPSPTAFQSPHRFHHPANPSSSPHHDQYQPLCSTLPAPKPRLTSNPISSAYQHPQYSRHPARYRWGVTALLTFKLLNILNILVKYKFEFIPLRM